MEVFETESPETSVKTEIEDSHSHILLSNHFLERKKKKVDKEIGEVLGRVNK